MQYRKWKRRNSDMDEDVMEWMSLSLTVTGRALSSASRQQSVHVIVASISIVARVAYGSARASFYTLTVEDSGVVTALTFRRRQGSQVTATQP